jgi:hypothetical protein
LKTFRLLSLHPPQNFNRPNFGVAEATGFKMWLRGHLHLPTEFHENPKVCSKVISVETQTGWQSYKPAFIFK